MTNHPLIVAPTQDPERRRASLLRRRRRALRNLIGPAMAGIGSAIIAVAVLQSAAPRPADVDPRAVASAVGAALASSVPVAAPSPEAIYAAVRPSLVVVEVTRDATKNSAAIGGAPGASAGPDIASGVVVSDRGEILTSLHVVAGAKKLAVTFADGTRSGAAIVKQRADLDIAVLSAGSPPASLQPATLGSSKVEVGSQVFVVGNPFGLDGSITGGIVSGVGRSYREPSTGQVFSGLIQVDAAVNPGSAGGALVDAAGEVVGIVSGLLNPTPDEVFIGIGLAVPIESATKAAGLGGV